MVGHSKKCHSATMRFSASNVANAVAWAVIFGLIGVAIVVADVLGFMGLLILGAMTCLVCMRAEMDQDVPTWGAEVFRAQMEGGGSPEQRAAVLEQQHAFTSPLRLCRRAGRVHLAAVVALMRLQQAANPVRCRAQASETCRTRVGDTSDFYGGYAGVSGGANL